MTDSNVVNMPTTEVRWYDSFINLLAGLGVMGRDKFAHQQYSFSLMTVLEQENAYRGDWLARKAVQIPAWDMTREWRNWQADPDQIKLLEAMERKLFLQQRVQEALIKSRLYGGAVMIIGVDAGKPEEELDLETVTLDSLKFLHVVSKNNIGVGPIIYDITSKYYGQPEYYEARTQPVGKDFDQKESLSKSSAFNKVNVKLHPSRVVKLIGVDTADQLIANVWGDSVLQPVNDAIKACGLVSGSLATLCSELKIDVIKIPELKSILSTDVGTRKMLGRFEAANVAKSTVNTILIDGNEEWQRIQASLAGVPEIIATYMQVVSGAVDIPAGRFLGLPHRGLNVTGEADFRNYYDRLASEQSVTLQPAISVLDEVLIRSALGDRPEEIFYEWNSLWQLSDGDKADIALKKAQAYQIDVNAAQIPPVALGNARANQLIEDGFYPGLEQALEDAAAEGDTIEEQNVPAPMPMMQPGVDPNTGQPLDPNAPPPKGGKGGAVVPFGKKPKSPQPGQTGQLPANARKSTAPGMRGSGDSDPFDDEEDAGNECHDPKTGEFCGEGGGVGAGASEGGAAKGEAGGHPGEGYSKSAYVDKNGVIQTTKVEDALRALYQNRRVNLDQPRKVSTLIKRLGQDVIAAVEKGDKAPNLNMCNVSVSGTNLFCAESKGIPRIKMPQLDEVQTKALLKSLKDDGYTVTKEKEEASHLKATQDELSGVKVWQQVQKAKLDPKRLDKRLVVSKDGYILDGHHHWAAKIGIDAKDNKLTGKMRISRVNISITDLLQRAKAFSGPAKSATQEVKIYFKKKKDGAPEVSDGIFDLDDHFDRLGDFHFDAASAAEEDADLAPFRLRAR
jgi:phage-related protein (TIGR01555 family)